MLQIDGRRRTTPRSLAAIALGLLLAAGGCSSDDEPGSPKTSASATEVPEGADAVATLIDEGLQQISAEDYDRARGTFDAVLTLDPENVYAHYNLGYISQQEGDVGSAVASYVKAIELDPEFAPGLYNLAILTEPSDLDAAVDLYRRVIETKPDDAPSYVRLGYALQHLGQKKEGKEMLDRGFEFDPSLADVPKPEYD